VNKDYEKAPSPIATTDVQAVSTAVRI